jgi:hypothetical protein
VSDHRSAAKSIRNKLGVAVTVHPIDRAFLRKRPAAALSISPSRIARRLSSGARWRDPLGQSALRALDDLLNRIKLMLPVQSPSELR